MRAGARDHREASGKQAGAGSSWLAPGGCRNGKQKGEQVCWVVAPAIVQGGGVYQCRLWLRLPLKHSRVITRVLHANTLELLLQEHQ